MSNPTQLSSLKFNPLPLVYYYYYRQLLLLHT